MTDMFPTIDQLKKLVVDPIAYHYQHRDGLRCTMMLMNGLVRDFAFAATIEGKLKPFSTRMYLPMPHGRTTLASFFSPLVHNAKLMFLTGKAQYYLDFLGYPKIGLLAPDAVWREPFTQRDSPNRGKYRGFSHILDRGWWVPPVFTGRFTRPLSEVQMETGNFSDHIRGF